jgi:hypothetical protein
MAPSWSCFLVKPGPTDTIIITVVASDNTNEVVVDAAATIRSAPAARRRGAVIGPAAGAGSQTSVKLFASSGYRGKDSETTPKRRNAIFPR